MDQVGKYYAETWFRIGDRDFANHLLRTAYLQQGFNLSEVTEKIRNSLGVKVKILPMTDHVVATKIKTPHGVLEFQEYFVKGNSRTKLEVEHTRERHMPRPPQGGIQAKERRISTFLGPGTRT